MKTTKSPGVASVDEYLSQLPPERRDVLAKLRQVVRNNLREGFEEGMQYGMIGYYVPHSLFPSGYHAKPSEPLPFVHIAAQKNHMAVYLMGLYGAAARESEFRDSWAKAGKKLDMGKSCIRFKSLEDLALDVLANAIRAVSVEQYISDYQKTLGAKVGNRPSKGTKIAKAQPKAKTTAKRVSANTLDVKPSNRETRPIARRERG